MRSAAAFKRKNDYIFHSYSETVVGVWVASPPFISITAIDNKSSLGQTIMSTIAAFKSAVPHPKNSEEWKAVQLPLFETFKVKSVSSQMKGTLYCLIKEEFEMLSINPTRNMGTKGGFVPIQGHEIKIPVNSPPEEIGEALLKGFELCK